MASGTQAIRWTDEQKKAAAADLGVRIESLTKTNMALFLEWLKTHPS